MTGVGQQTQQLQQELQNELLTANQLLRLISTEIQQIKYFTNPGGEFETNIKENATLMKTLANLQHVDLENLPQALRSLPNRTSQKQSAEETQAEIDDSQ